MRKYVKILILLCAIPAIVTFVQCGPGDQKKNDQQNNDSLPADLKALNEKIDKDPENALLYNQRAVYFTKERQAEKALTDIRKAIELDGENPLFYRTLADVYFFMGKVDNCRESLNKAVTIDEKDTAAYLKLAELEFYFKEYKKSFDFIDQALALDPNNATAYFMRGMAFKELGDTVQAIKALLIAVENNQDYYDAWMQLGMLHMSKRNPLTVDYFNNALNVDPESVEAYYALGMFYQETGEYNKAIETYTNLLKIDPKYKTAHYNLGYIHLVYLEVYDVAAKHFTDAINCDPQYAEAWYNRGYCYELLGNVMAARSDYQQAAMIRPNYQKAIDRLNHLDAVINMK